MNRLFAIVILIFTASAISAESERKVYICTSTSAYTYHTDKKCKGLNRCSREIRMVSVGEAKEMGRRLCKMCSKKRPQQKKDKESVNTLNRRK